MLRKLWDSLFPEEVVCHHCGTVKPKREMVKGYPGRFCSQDHVDAYWADTWDRFKRR